MFFVKLLIGFKIHKKLQNPGNVKIKNIFKLLVHFKFNFVMQNIRIKIIFNEKLQSRTVNTITHNNILLLVFEFTAIVKLVLINQTFFSGFYKQDFIFNIFLQNIFFHKKV